MYIIEDPYGKYTINFTNIVSDLVYPKRGLGRLCVHKKEAIKCMDNLQHVYVFRAFRTLGRLN